MQNNKSTEVRVIDNIPVYNLQYAFISLWESVPLVFSSEFKRSACGLTGLGVIRSLLFL